MFAEGRIPLWLVATIVRSNESKTFGVVKPFYFSCYHFTIFPCL